MNTIFHTLLAGFTSKYPNFDINKYKILILSHRLNFKSIFKKEKCSIYRLKNIHRVRNHKIYNVYSGFKRLLRIQSISNQCSKGIPFKVLRLSVSLTAKKIFSVKFSSPNLITLVGAATRPCTFVVKLESQSELKQVLQEMFIL